jgi:hypothetical protein
VAEPPNAVAISVVPPGGAAIRSTDQFTIT